MNRNVLFVLMLAPGVVLAGDTLEAAQAPSGSGAQTKTEAPPVKADSQVKAQASQEEAPTQTDTEGKVVSTPGGKALGMSILGNQEAPTSLVIVPWKTSELGKSLGISPMLDDSRQPVDKDVFTRALRYYEISSGSAGAKSGGRDNAAAGSDAAQSTTATPRR